MAESKTGGGEATTASVRMQVLPGSLFCTKVWAALNAKGVKMVPVAVHPTKLKKQVPAPHLVPVMYYKARGASKETVVPDSAAILKFIDSRSTVGAPLYPRVRSNGQFATVDEAETWAHDTLSHLYYYWGGISAQGRRTVTKPFLKRMLPGCVTAVFCCLPALGAKAGAAELRKRVGPVLGTAADSDEAARQALFDATTKLERCFLTDGQQFLFPDTTGPTAADFGVFCVLKRLLHSLEEVAKGLQGGYPTLFKEVRTPRLQAYFHRMNRAYYVGTVDWSNIWF